MRAAGVTCRCGLSPSLCAALRRVLLRGPLLYDCPGRRIEESPRAGRCLALRWGSDPREPPSVPWIERVSGPPDGLDAWEALALALGSAMRARLEAGAALAAASRDAATAAAAARSVERSRRAEAAVARAALSCAAVSEALTRRNRE